MFQRLASLTFAILLFNPMYANAFMLGSDQQVNQSFSIQFAEYLTHPIVVTILLSIGFVGLVLELFSPRFGIPGIIGLLAFLLFFYGHIASGIASISVIFLFAFGVILFTIEFVVPGGIIGLVGFCLVLASFFIADDNFLHMGISLIIAISLSIVTIMILIKVYDKQMNFFKKLILKDSTNTENGYVSNQNRLDLVDVIGIAQTDLRPSGTVIVGDERIDVVTEGGYIKKDSPVKIIKVEGARIVVRELKK